MFKKYYSVVVLFLCLFLIMVYCLHNKGLADSVLALRYTDMEADSMVLFENTYYTVTKKNSGVCIQDNNGKELIKYFGYSAEYGSIHNVKEVTIEKGMNVVTVDQTKGLDVEDTIYIVAETFMGRMNKPLVQEARIDNINDDKVTFYPSLNERYQYGIYIKKISDVINEPQTVIQDLIRYDDKTEMLLTCDTGITDILFKFTFCNDSPSINICIETSYKKYVNVFRESMTLQFEDRVNEVYRKNRKLDDKIFQKEYYLDKQGVKFGKGLRSVWLYNCQGISSLVLRTKEKQLTVNIDSMQDHRFHKAQTIKGVGEVKSFSTYAPGDVRVNMLEITVGKEPFSTPRLMLQPEGYLATHIWVTHPDEGTLESNRAIFYGRGDILTPVEAVGGFIKHNIPITKGTFYSNTGYKTKTPWDVAVKQEPEYACFLEDIYTYGNEICLHTVSPRGNPDRELYIEAMNYMDKFKAATWIDHGYLGVNIGFDGLNKESLFFGGDLWRSHNIKYFWHYSSEDITTTDQGKLDLMQIRNGDNFITPLYWQHPTVTGNFYTFSTAVIYPGNYKVYNSTNLKELIGNWGVFINHSYPSRVNGKNPTDYIITDKHGIMNINPEFNNLLAEMAGFRDEGLLYLATIKEMMDYWTALENIKMEILTDGSIKITNFNYFMIKNMSLAVKASQVLVDGAEVCNKKVKNDIIIWFDIDAFASKVISGCR